MSRVPAVQKHALAAAASAREAARHAESAAQAAETAAMLAVLDVTSGNELAAAAVLGMDVRTLQRRLAAVGHDAEWRRQRWPLSGRQPR